jgi:outer membrane receptor for ferrienterochelin and colicins
MKKILMPAWLLLFFISARGQYNFKSLVTDSVTHKPIARAMASVKGVAKSGISDDHGFLVIKDLREGAYDILFTADDYSSVQLTFTMNGQNEKDTFIIFMTPLMVETEEVIVSTTRTSRSIDDVPTRIETISEEELDEKANMRPSNVSMILHESTGIQVQQTSAVSGSQGIRIQGLDGKYTQLLKDGYPDYGDFAGGLSILEIPPGDLKQVEIIKGPASTLYGGGAIAGVINFVSKKPADKPEYLFMLNQSHIGQTNLSAYLSQKKNKLGYSLFVIGNKQQAYDADHDEFTELPKANDFTLHPRLFLYPGKKSELSIGSVLTSGTRRGGDIHAVNFRQDSLHSWFEENNSIRSTTNLDYDLSVNDEAKISFRSSFTYFKRSIGLRDWMFKGESRNLYSDLAYTKKMRNQLLIAGVNYISSGFIERGMETRDFRHREAGIYVQHSWDIGTKLKFENGLRLDFTRYGNSLYSKQEYFPLPRISVLYKFNRHFSTRIGGGMGYKLPSLFTEQTESMQYRNIRPLEHIVSERSTGGTVDFDYKTAIGKNLYFTINQLFFYTRIEKPTVLIADTLGKYYFINAGSPVISKGFETNLKLVYKKAFKLFAGYSNIDARALYLPGNQLLPLQPKHKLNLALVYEKEDFMKVGLEAYFTGKQYLSNGIAVPSFYETGIMAEKFFHRFSVFINLENMNNVMQAHYSPVVHGSHVDPAFDEIWTHTEGFIMNGGIKLRL